jgi:hypothetical protein
MSKQTIEDTSLQLLSREALAGAVGGSLSGNASPPITSVPASVAVTTGTLAGALQPLLNNASQQALITWCKQHAEEIGTPAFDQGHDAYIIQLYFGQK